VALDFGYWVIAFLTLDSVFAVVVLPISSIQYPNINGVHAWLYHAPTLKALPARHINILVDYEAWVCSVVKWAKLRSHKARKNLAIHAVREANTEWGGVGVYTVLELFFIAGLRLSF